MASLCRSAVARRPASWVRPRRGCKAKGYKLHAVVGSDGSIAACRVAPMQKDERAMGRRMLASGCAGYLLAVHFARQLHDVCLARRALVAPPRYGFGRRRGHRRQVPLGCDLLLLSSVRRPCPPSDVTRRATSVLEHLERRLQACRLGSRPPRVHRWCRQLIFTALRACHAYVLTLRVRVSRIYQPEV